MDITPLLDASTDDGFNIYAVVIKRVCQVVEFIDGSDELNQKQVFNLFELITNTGPPHNETKFNDLGDGIFELKTRGGLRIMCFTGGPGLLKSLVLTHAIHKPHAKILKREITKALGLKQRYFQESVTIIDQ